MIIVFSSFSSIPLCGILRRCRHHKHNTRTHTRAYTLEKEMKRKRKNKKKKIEYHTCFIHSSSPSHYHEGEGGLMVVNSIPVNPSPILPSSGWLVFFRRSVGKFYLSISKVNRRVCRKFVPFLSAFLKWRTDSIE